MSGFSKSRVTVIAGLDGEVQIELANRAMV